MRRVLLDFDGVIVDMLGSLQRTLSAEGISFNPEGVETYDFHGSIGCDRQKVYDCLDHRAVYAGAQFYNGVEDSLEKLKNHAEVYCYSSVVPNPFVMLVRQHLIKDIGIKGDLYVGEKPVLDGYDALFEDCPEVVERYRGRTDVYLIDHTYNKNVQTGNGIERFSTFVEAVESFCSKS